MRLNNQADRFSIVSQISHYKQAGVSLLEFVLGLVLLSIVLLGITLFYAGQKQQLDPVFQFRAVSLAEALAEQVLAVKYDANNNPFTQTRCGVDLPLTCSNARENDHDTLNTFDNVDDFNLWCDKEGAGGTPINGATLAAQLGLTRTELYKNFTVQVCVDTDHVFEQPPYKEVSINISINSGTDITFKLQRYNIR